jgi:hypothetical protein
MSSNIATTAPMAPDTGPRRGARVRIVGRGYGVGWAGTITSVGPSRWDGGLVWLVRLDNGKSTAKRRHQLAVETV